MRLTKAHVPNKKMNVRTAAPHVLMTVKIKYSPRLQIRTEGSDLLP